MRSYFSPQQAHIHIGALIHNAKRQIIDKITRDLVRNAPLSNISKLRKQAITYIQPVALRTGHYTIDTAVVDEEADKASAQRIAEFVSAPNGIAVSSIAIVKRFEPLESRRDPRNPFELVNGRVLPAVDGSVPGSKPADVYFVVYPKSPPGAAKPRAVVQLFENGVEIARQTPCCPPRAKMAPFPCWRNFLSSLAGIEFA